MKRAVCWCITATGRKGVGEKMSANKAFGAFVMQAAGLKFDKAVAVAVYVESRRDYPHHVRARIAAACEKGFICPDRRTTLDRLADELTAYWKRYGKAVDVRDPRDWEELGNGARMRKTHKNCDTLPDK